MEYYQSTVEETLKDLDTNLSGLTIIGAQKRLEKYGLNQLTQTQKFNALKLLIGEFTSSLVLILIVSGIISLILGEALDAGAIFAIVILNGLLGFFQEYKAEKAMEALKKLTALNAIVIRNHQVQEIDSKFLVPGDIVVLEEGSKVPADLRMIESIEIKMDEAILTGESNPVSKTIEKINRNCSLGDRTNIAFANTVVVRGRGKGVVIGTAKNTEFGKIASTITEIEEEETPLKKKLETFSKQISIFVVAIMVIVFIVGVIRGKELFDMFLVGVTLGVAALPEGLPAIITISLALGIQQMAKRNAIVRRMPAVETLGSTTVICSDKTGTLTKNEMTAEVVFANNCQFEVTGAGYSVEGGICFNKKPVNLTSNTELKRLLEIAWNCNNGSLHIQGKTCAIIGDPTECALSILAVKMEQNNSYTRLHEIPFSSERKMMSTVNVVAGKRIAFTKGAIEKVLQSSTFILEDGKIKPFNESRKQQILGHAELLSKSAYRVLAFSYKELTGNSDFKEIESGQVFVGMVGLVDPPREEVKLALKACKTAGIKVKVVTGDNALTAQAIGQKLGLGGSTITGEQLDLLSGSQLKETIKNTSIFARVNPNHKYLIVKTLREMGEIVAVTGDGVNDAPALKEADIGIAMGIKGTDVTKEASVIILKDDNFATIVGAVEEGRKIYSNIRAFVRYLLSANFGEIIYISIMNLFFSHIVLLPLQILWLNLATDALPALALGKEKGEKDAMSRPPRNPNESILSGMTSFIVIAGIAAAAAAIAAFFYGQQESFEKGRTMAFTVAVMFELAFVFSCRKDGKSALQLNPISNPVLVGAVVVSMAGQVFILNAPILQEVFKTMPLTVEDWAVAILLSFTSILVPHIDNTVKAMIKDFKTIPGKK